MPDLYHRWLGIPPDQRPPTYYQLLGIAPAEQNRDVIESSAVRQAAYVRNFQSGAHARDCARILGEIAQARLTLLDPARRAAYDAGLPKPPATPEVGPVAVAPGLAIAVAPEAIRPRAPRPSSGRFAKVATHLTITACTLAVGVVFLGKHLNQMAAPGSPPAVGTPAPATPKSAELALQASPPAPVTPPPPSIIRIAPPPPRRGPGPRVAIPSPEPIPSRPRPARNNPKGPEGFAGAPAQPVAEMLPPPGDAEIEKARASIKDLYKVEYSRKTEADRLTLARTLADLAEKSPDDPAARYVLRREASTLFAGTGSVPAALQAVDALAQEFDIDAAMLKAEALEVAARPASRTPKDAGEFAEATIGVIDEAITSDSVEAATRLLPVARSAAKKTRSGAMEKRVQAQEKDVARLKAALDRADDATATLKDHPNDAEANLTLGRFYCFTKGDWKRGLPHLARGSDPVLAAAARNDLAEPEEPSEQVKVADAWWAVTADSEPIRRQFQRRAGFWYQAARPGLTGLELARIEKRLALAPDPGSGAASGPMGELRRLVGHMGAVKSVVFSPNGRHALSGGGYPNGDRTVRLWDVETGRELRRFLGHSDQVESVAFSPDGRRALSAACDRTIRLWDVETGAEVRHFEGHEGAVISVSYAPDGRRALSGSNDTTLRLWDVETGRELRRFAGHTGFVESVAFSPDGRRAASGSNDSTIGIWDVATGRNLWRLQGHLGPVEEVAFSPDGRYLVSASLDSTVGLWDLKTGLGIRRLQGHTESVQSVAYLPDGRRAVSGGRDRTIRLWDLRTGRELQRFDLNVGRVTSVAVSPDGRRVLGACQEGFLWLGALPDVSATPTTRPQRRTSPVERGASDARPTPVARRLEPPRPERSPSSGR